MKESQSETIFSFVQNDTFPESRPFEVVERKGIGHPDTIADSLAEVISNAYSRYTMGRFGAVLHHHVDKLYIGGGEADIGFGLSRMVRPIRVVVNGRFSHNFGPEAIPVNELAEEAARARLALVLPRLNVDTEVVFEHSCNDTSMTPQWYRPRSLEDLPDAHASWANDTAICIGYYPLTITERIALQAEQFFYGPSLRPKYEYLGQDIKVMVVRHDRAIHVTVCLPFIGALTPSVDWYFERQEEIHTGLRGYLAELAGDQYGLRVYINTEDNNPYRKHHYLSAIGSCIDVGEEGVVGRGNAPSGFIACWRPHSMEAAFGKNPTYHTGRIYGLLTRHLARILSEELQQSVTVAIVTQNGRPLLPPFAMQVQISGEADSSAIRTRCFGILEEAHSLEALLDGGLVPSVGG